MFWCISVEYLGCIVLMNVTVSPRWRHRSNLWRHESATWHSNMISISVMVHKCQKNHSIRIHHLAKRFETRNSWFEINVRSTEVTDLRWPRWPNRQCANSSLAMSWPNDVQILSFASMAPSQVARKHDFVAKVAGGCSSYDVIAPWPDLTRSIFFCQKLRKVCPIR